MCLIHHAVSNSQQLCIPASFDNPNSAIGSQLTIGVRTHLAGINVCQRARVGVHRLLLQVANKGVAGLGPQQVGDEVGVEKGALRRGRRGQEVDGDCVNKEQQRRRRLLQHICVRPMFARVYEESR